jgi:formylglycine-generating enzyme required for sulfatase activity
MKTIWLLVAVILVVEFVWPATVSIVKINPKDGAEMVWVPAGEFLMGSDYKTNRDISGPAILDVGEMWGSYSKSQKVYLDGYWIYKYEVTVAQYRKFCSETRRKIPYQPKWGWIDNHPIVNVTPKDAVDYANWAGASLPTETQWEKAARGTDGREYPWGNVWDVSKCNEPSKGPQKTQPVGTYPAGASPYGCMDMTGNVFEMYADWYIRLYHKTDPTKKNFYGYVRDLRGGSWGYDGGGRCARQTSICLESGISDNIGFRLVR